VESNPIGVHDFDAVLIVADWLTHYTSSISGTVTQRTAAGYFAMLVAWLRFSGKGESLSHGE
jgi:hypothetical protein